MIYDEVDCEMDILDAKMVMELVLNAKWCYVATCEWHYTPHLGTMIV